MLIEIFECLDCNRRLVRIGGKHVKAHNCTGNSLKLLAEAEVSSLKLRSVLLDLMQMSMADGPYREPGKSEEQR